MRILGLGIRVLNKKSGYHILERQVFIDGDLVASVLDVDNDIFEGISNFMEISENEFRKK
ncbi:hypothetical protein Tco_0479599, partial [Tanacetum coccineum]